MQRISFDTMDVAATPRHDIGVWHLDVPDEEVAERVDSLVALGFKPVVRPLERA